MSLLRRPAALLLVAGVAGDDDALQYMQTYNKGDVELLEKIYLKLRPWIKNHPNIGLYIESMEEVCPNCGNENLTWVEDKFYYTQTSKFPLFLCTCGAYGRSRKSIVSKEVKKSLIVGLAK